MEQKPLFAKGIYSKEDKPIKLLNKLIGGVIILLILLVVYFAIHGGFTISFEMDGGSRVENQIKRHGSLLDEPETPVKEGYEFVCFTTSPDGNTANAWNFEDDKVQESMTLYAVWKEK